MTAWQQPHDMNTPSLRSWAAQWAANRLLSDSPLTPPEPNPSSGAFSGHINAVGAAGGFVGSLLAQLHSAVTPDDAQKAERSGALTVGIGGRLIPRVPIVRGQIRQLNPELNPTWGRSVIVLILRVDDKEAKALAVPFGEFTEPAFEGELATGLRDQSMAVLCVWNASWVRFDKLSRSWWLTDAFDDQLHDAAALYDARARREPVPAALQARTGPPILHPLDPRHDYLDAEAGLLEDLNVDI
jgi:hypothetical protein